MLGSVLFILYTTPLSLITEKHSVNHEMFADDTQFCKSVPPTDYDNMLLSLQNCTAEVKYWMLENKLKLNDEKTEAICFSPPSFCLAYSLSDSISLVSCNIQFTRKVRDLGFWLDSDVTTKQHVIKIFQSAYLQLKHISSICQYLTEEATKTLVTSCKLSRLDFCNSLLVATPNSIIQPLQTLQNSAARLVFRSQRTQHCTPLLNKLHCLAIMST